MSHTKRMNTKRMNQALKLFDEYCQLKNNEYDPKDYPTTEDYMDDWHSNELAVYAIRLQIRTLGFETVFKEYDGVEYKFQLLEKYDTP